MKYGSFKYGQYAYGDIGLVPFVTAVSITPNPVSINANFAIAVSVTEVEVIMYKVSAVSGALKSGQAINLSTRKEVS